MLPLASVHVLSAHRAGLFVELSRRHPAFNFRHWRASPGSTAVSVDDAVVLDLDDPPPMFTYADFLRIPSHCLDIAVMGDAAIGPQWVQAVADGRLRLLNGPRLSNGNLAEVAAAVAMNLGVPRSLDCLTELVINKVPSMAGARDMIGIVATQPWRVRHPGDLARALAVPRREIQARCRALGFSRTEHFITAIRVVMVDVAGQRRAASLLVAGVGDRANHLRQLRRAEEGSPIGVAHLRRDGLLAVLLVALVGGGCRDRPRTEAANATTVVSPAETTMALPVLGTVVRRGDLVLTVRATGMVRAERLVSLHVETQGTVAEVRVRSGESVAAGQVLARLDLRPFDIAAREAESGLAEAQMRFADAMIGVASTDSSDPAVARRQSARLRSGIAAAEARVERARLDREHATVTAPFGGVLDEVSIVAGQGISPGDVVARLVDMTNLTIQATVLEHDLGLVRVGAVATVTPSGAGGDRLRGTVAAVLPIVDTVSRSGRVLVSIRTPSGALRPGMYADVELEATRLRDRVIVPAAAVIERDGRPLVFRARSGRAEWVYVEVGRSNGAETEVLADTHASVGQILPGDTVLVSGHLTLTHDAPIAVQVRR